MHNLVATSLNIRAYGDIGVVRKCRTDDGTWVASDHRPPTTDYFLLQVLSHHVFRHDPSQPTDLAGSLADAFHPHLALILADYLRKLSSALPCAYRHRSGIFVVNAGIFCVSD
ncbi:predicted protein [Pyrenophora tritici-repentis Pt-1C-BFP]|uniref:Uncharacterized protein n=1 Tax=Pyrenophora tritici-repentis (strain Pt-1C-BFP) TaxID=426418 RepID=B2WH45_PYRTR|nr:uncharacterized protein PTRG_09304 [Pyrenophora tritici-repentis Pt-1C-BFP]EDU42355.1 predicted protein [Pyrenophora tritici-repentis Pt-1C-BFP]